MFKRLFIALTLIALASSAAPPPSLAADPPPLDGKWLCQFPPTFPPMESLWAILMLAPVPSDPRHASVNGSMIGSNNVSVPVPILSGSVYVPKGGAGGSVALAVEKGRVIKDQVWNITAVGYHSGGAAYFDVQETVQTGGDPGRCQPLK